MSGIARISWFCLAVGVITLSTIGLIPFFSSNPSFTAENVAHYVASLWAWFCGLGLLIFSAVGD